MRIRKHDKSHIVELSDGSTWRIWPGDAAKTLQWLPTTDLDVLAIPEVVDVEDGMCSHALVDRRDGCRVRAIRANAGWSVRAVRRSLAAG
jgi:hypothetical protein